MSRYLRFLLSPEDRDRIDPLSITQFEVPFEPWPAATTDRWPESLRITFRIRDPQNGAPVLRMIFPGAMRFTPAGIGILPQPADVQPDATTGKIAAQRYAAWANYGRLRIHALAWAEYLPLRNATVPALGVGPNVAWFDPVEIPLDFLNDALLGQSGLQRLRVGRGPAAEPLNLSDPSWPASAVSAFYFSLYEPRLRLHDNGSATRDPARDDVMRLPMPRLVMTAVGDVDLTITLAAVRSSDELKPPYEAPSFPNADDGHPGQARYEAVPTRAFFQERRADLIGAETTNLVANRLITERYLPRVKSNLEEAGFGDLGATSDFDLATSRAIRELQIAATSPNLAVEAPGAAEYALRLAAVPNDQRYTGPLNGQLNALTRRALAWWLNPARNYRCPVVVTARLAPDYQQVAPEGESLWGGSSLPSNGPRMLVLDLSGRYTLPAKDALDVQVGGARFIVLGYYDNKGGPNMEPQHSWATMAYDSLPVMGIAEATLASDATHERRWSTYFTILPTIDKEAYGRFDIVNAWDSGTISIPPFHYTLGEPGEDTKGELGGFLSYLRHRDRNLFDQAIGGFGIRPVRVWPDTERLQAKYVSGIEAIQAPGTRHSPWPGGSDREYFRSWHWVYRFVMANRLFDRWKAIAYDFARLRLHELSSVRMAGVPNGVIPPVLADGGAATLGDVYSSELSRAMVLRWHVYRPGHLVASDRATGHLWEALRRAQQAAPALSWTPPATTWTRQHLDALVQGLRDEVLQITPTSTRDLLRDHFNFIVNHFTRRNRTLSREPRTMLLDDPPPR